MQIPITAEIKFCPSSTHCFIKKSSLRFNNGLKNYKFWKKGINQAIRGGLFLTFSKTLTQIYNTINNFGSNCQQQDEGKGKWKGRNKISPASLINIEPLELLKLKGGLIQVEDYMMPNIFKNLRNFVQMPRNLKHLRDKLGK